MKNKSIFLPIICLLSLSACNGRVKYLDDVDLTYYVHHINHSIYTNARSAIVTIKDLGSNDFKSYRFEGLVWADEDYFWTDTVICEEYENDGRPLDYVFTENSIINDEIAAGFINNQYWDYISAIDYYGDSREERQEESFFHGRIAKLKGNKLTLITQWTVVSFTDKREIDCGDEESVDYEYVDPKGLICVSKAIYSGEKLNSYSLYLINELYMRDDDWNGIIEYHEEVFDKPIDYLSYSVSFKG